MSHDLAVTVGIAVSASLIALWQFLDARAYRKVAEARLNIAVDAIKDAKEMRDLAVTAMIRVEIISAVLPLHHAAAKRGDALQCNMLLHEAVARSNAVAARAGEAKEGAS